MLEKQEKSTIFSEQTLHFVIIEIIMGGIGMEIEIYGLMKTLHEAEKLISDYLTQAYPKKQFSFINGKYNRQLIIDNKVYDLVIHRKQSNILPDYTYKTYKIVFNTIETLKRIKNKELNGENKM